MTNTPPTAPRSAPQDVGRVPDSTSGEMAPVPPAELAPFLEALLLMAEEPIDLATLSEASGTAEPQVLAALEELAAFYDETGRGFQLRHVGGGWRYYPRAAQHERIAAWVRAGGQNRLSQAAMETLAVIAYLQPVARSRVSAVRGVNVDGVVRTLLSRGLVDERGSDAQTGAGLLVTTDYFLSRLGLSALSDLPDIAPLLPDAAALEAELTSLAAPAGSDASSQATNEAAPRDRPDDGGRDEVPQEGSHTNG